MTSCGGGPPVSWDGGDRGGGGGKGRASLSRSTPLGGRVSLGKRVIF